MSLSERVACIAALVMSVVVGSAVLSSCETPVKNDTEVSGFGVTIRSKTEVNGPGKNSVTGTYPPGKCLKITYRGPDGAVTGTDTSTAPGSSQIPPGSTSQSFEWVDCPDSQGSLAGTSHLTRRRRLVTEIFGAPIVLDTVDGGLLRNAVYKFRVTGAGESAWDDILPLLLGGPGTSVPANVEVLSFTQCIPEAVGVRVVAADTDAFDEFRLDLNASYGYADLASATNTLQYTAPHGWHVVETFISAMDFLPFGEENVVSTTTSTMGESSSVSLTGRSLYYP